MELVTIGLAVFSGLLSAAQKASANDLTPEERDAIHEGMKASVDRNTAIADAAIAKAEADKALEPAPDASPVADKTDPDADPV